MNTTETIEKLPHETVLAELCFLETVEENPTTKAALNQAITLLQNKEKDTERYRKIRAEADRDYVEMRDQWFESGEDLDEAVDCMPAIAAQQEAESV